MIAYPFQSGRCLAPEPSTSKMLEARSCEDPSVVTVCPRFGEAENLCLRHAKNLRESLDKAIRAAEEPTS